MSTLELAKIVAHAICFCLYVVLTMGVKLSIVYAGISIAYAILLACDLRKKG